MSTINAAKYLSMSLNDFATAGTIAKLDADYEAGNLTAAEYTSIMKYRDKLYADEWQRRMNANLSINPPSYPSLFGTVVESVFGNPGGTHDQAVNQMNQVSPPSTLIPKAAQAVQDTAKKVGEAIVKPLENIGLIIGGVVVFVVLIALKGR